MKILMVTPMPPQRQAPGAIPLVLYAGLSGLRGRHEITVLTVAGPDRGEWAAVESLRAEGVTVHVAWRGEPAGADRWRRRWRLASDWLGGKYPWRTVWFREPLMQGMIERLVVTQPFDLIAVEDNAMGSFHYPRLIPTVFTEHEVRRPRPFDWHSILSPARLLGELDWRRWPRYERSVWLRFSRVQVFSERDAASLRALAPALGPRVRVNPFGVNLPPAADPANEEDDTIVFAGNFTHPPNVDAATWLGREIMPLLRERHPAARLLLIGPQAPPEVRDLAGDGIEFLGQVPEIEPYLERAALVVAPLRIGGGQRMKVLQGMAMGKAVVTTPRGADGLEMAGIKAPLAVAADAPAIAAAAATLLAAPQARRELGRQARRFVELHYSPAAYARRLEAVYGELVETAVPV